ncbi:hypothetical protein [Spongiactinospora rosea]|uniref:hypothetical protein n=1 Tax=Spongiactinospora rosea TaxID=2248750 RepID=UPI0011C083D5|nr:hypothetical protein [Spongiactinospora rosea]
MTTVVRVVTVIIMSSAEHHRRKPVDNFRKEYSKSYVFDARFGCTPGHRGSEQEMHCPLLDTASGDGGSHNYH